MTQTFEQYLEEKPSVAIPNDLIENVIPSNSIGLLSGLSDSYKTFMGLSLALSVATGMPWHGNEARKHFVYFLTTDKIPELEKRILAWTETNAVAEEMLIPLFFDNHWINFDDFQAVEKLADKVLLSRFSYMNQSSSRERSFEEMLSGEDWKIFLVIDSFVDLSPHIGWIFHLLKRRINASVLLIQPAGFIKEKSVFDYEFHVEKISKLLVKMTCMKMKDAPKPGDLWFVGKQVSLEGKSIGLNFSKGN